MRYQPPFTCDACGNLQTVGRRCIKCDGELADSAGQVLASRSDRVYRALTNKDRAGLIALPMMAIAVAAIMLEARSLLEPPTWLLGVAIVLLCAVVLPWYVGRFHLRARRHDRGVGQWVDRWLDKAGAIKPIADANKVAHVRGRVLVLRAVEGADEDVAVLRRREVHEVEEIRVGPHGRQHHATRHMLESSACGRFAIHDESGLAIVDDDAFVLWSDAGMAINEADAIVVAEGDEVEVAGIVSRQSVDDLPAQAAGYPPGKARAVFDGSKEPPVIIKALP